MNWTVIIDKLQKAGYSQKQIAEYCECSQGLISQIKTKYSIYDCYSSPDNKRTKSVSYKIGTKLVELYNNVIMKEY